MTPAHILVVDDYAVSQRLLRQILQKGGYQVAIAEDGYRALAQIEANAFDLVVLDVSMPRMDGMQVLTKLRSDERFKNLPVIMLTASGDDQIRENAKKVGANAFLTKPSSSSEVLSTIKMLLQ
jgi:CheY-like chemotaxis protein